MIYQPAEDSYLLRDVLRKYVKNKSVLDVGTGSGILALEALNNGAKSVVASDINSESIIHFKNNHILFIKSNLFSKIKDKFDIILFNPPYLPRNHKEPKDSQISTTGGEKGDEIILRFLNQASKYLNKNGKILLLLSSLTPRERILMRLKKFAFKYRIIAKKNLFMEQLEVFEIKQ